MTEPDDAKPDNSGSHLDDPTESAEADARADQATVGLPALIGRYHVEGELGRGGFGIVYLSRSAQSLAPPSRARRGP